jgi:hypothetical protein
LEAVGSQFLLGDALFVGAARNIRVNILRGMTLEHTDAEAMTRRAGAVVRDRPREEVAAGDVAVDERSRCAARVKPVDALESTERNLGRSPIVPLTLDGDERFVTSVHGPSCP